MLLRIAASIFCYDIWFYVSHRLLHTPYLWPIHRIHHERHEPTYWDAYHGHWFEPVFQSVGTFFPYLFMSYSWMETVIILLLLNIRGMLRHETRLVGWWGEIDHHIEHHRRPRYNYGERWIDVWCGTYWCDTYGYGNVSEEMWWCMMYMGCVCVCVLMVWLGIILHDV
jgi:sterol desaturase/sphingolipid hydroxylase (fatty acid hydroxylase superfamily)